MAVRFSLHDYNKATRAHGVTHKTVSEWLGYKDPRTWQRIRKKATDGLVTVEPLRARELTERLGLTPVGEEPAEPDRRQILDQARREAVVGEVAEIAKNQAGLLLAVDELRTRVRHLEERLEPGQTAPTRNLR